MRLFDAQMFHEALAQYDDSKIVNALETTGLTLLRDDEDKEILDLLVEFGSFMEAENADDIIIDEETLLDIADRLDEIVECADEAVGRYGFMGVMKAVKDAKADFRRRRIL